VRADYHFANGPAFTYGIEALHDYARPPFSIFVPSATGGRTDVSVEFADVTTHASSTQWVRGVPDDVNALTFQPPEPAVIKAPKAGDFFTPGAAIAWSAPALEGAVHCARFESVEDGGGCLSTISACTTATSITTPDPTAFGLPANLPGSCRLSVKSVGPFESVDALLENAAGDEALGFRTVSAALPLGEL
jgi:hypothetical protein